MIIYQITIGVLLLSLVASIVWSATAKAFWKREHSAAVDVMAFQFGQIHQLEAERSELIEEVNDVKQEAFDELMRNATTWERQHADLQDKVREQRAEMDQHVNTEWWRRPE